MIREEKKISLGIITAIPFPFGLAGTNRIISYARGLVELGNQVTVLTSHFNEDGLGGWYDGIIFKGFRRKHKSGILNKISIPFAVLRQIFYLFKTAKSYNIILIVSNSLILILLTYLACKIRKLKLVQEKSEFPFVLRNKSVFGRLYAQLYVNNIYRLFDGLIIMTHPLFEYFKDKTKKGCQKIIVPMTVEPERFENVNLNNKHGDYIAYCGYMGGNKDGVINLIKAFSTIEKKYEQLKLLLIGTATQAELLELKQLVEDLKINNVVFYGSVTRNEMPLLLCGAKVLALARPSSLQSTGGFPTKLGEYLATGKPVVVTKVGDIPKYLEDGENAYLVEPDDNTAFAEKIDFVLSHYDDALKIAQKGKELTNTVFNYKVQSKRMHGFLIGLVG